MNPNIWLCIFLIFLGIINLIIWHILRKKGHYYDHVRSFGLLLSSAFIIIWTLVLLLGVSCVGNQIEKEPKNCAEMIDKYLLLHEIKNKTLKEHIARFDSIYNEGERGIMISCRILNDTITYSIGYQSPSTHSSAPMIKCEPINGREVTMVFEDFMYDVELSADRALELNRCLLSDEDYREYKKIITANKKSEYKEHIISMNDKISLTLFFDRNQNLLRVDTLGIW